MDKGDILIDVHPDLGDDERDRLENEIATMNGVMRAYFAQNHPNGHGLYVEYDMEVLHAREILDEVKRWDPNATMAGL